MKRKKWQHNVKEQQSKGQGRRVKKKKKGFLEAVIAGASFKKGRGRPRGESILEKLKACARFQRDGAARSS